MFLKQGDLYWGLDHEFIKALMAKSDQRSYRSEEIIFQEGDTASAFYSLIQGRVRLSIGSTGRMVHVVNRAGESFGWSSLVGRDTYSATATCRMPTQLLQIDRAHFDRILERFPVDGMRVFKRLAGLLGGRLLNTYELLSERLPVEAYISEGTGQLQARESAEI